MLARRTSYERKTRELFDDLGLDGSAYRNASNRLQKLNPALKELTGVRLSTGFITSATLEKTADGKDYKIVISKDTQQQLPLVVEAEDDRVETPVESIPRALPDNPHARELVDHFHRLFHNVTLTVHASKAINHAIALIAQHGTELARFIVDFAHREAGKTNYHPQAFGGILQYVPRAVAEYTNAKARSKTREALAACSHCDANGYATFTTEKGSGVCIQCPHNLDAIHSIEAARAWRLVTT